jgi:hypothetical protein
LPSCVSNGAILVVKFTLCLGEQLSCRRRRSCLSCPSCYYYFSRPDSKQPSRQHDSLFNALSCRRRRSCSSCPSCYYYFSRPVKGSHWATLNSPTGSRNRKQCTLAHLSIRETEIDNLSPKASSESPLCYPAGTRRPSLFQE